MILCIDIGGTSVKLGIADRSGRIYARDEKSVSFDHYATPILETVVRQAKRFVQENPFELEGIGVSAAGQVDDQRGIVIGTNGKIPGYEGSEIKKELEAVFQLPVSVLNDANAAVLGETFVGRARNLRHVVMVTLGTGVGGGIVVDGKLLSGKRGIAGEIGHFTLYQGGELCPCGKRGCYESYASTTALVRMSREKTGDRTLDGRGVFRRAEEGDPVILAVLGKWIDDIAAGITGLVHIFNPQMVIVGGGVSAQEKLLMQPLKKKVLQTVMPRFAQGLEMEAALVKNDAGMLGAARFWMDQHPMERE